MYSTPVILVMQDCSLPTGEDTRERFVRDLSGALANVFVDYELFPEISWLYDGPVYAQTNLHLDCPECGDRLMLKNLRLGPQNGADAQAVCDCGWRGRAVFRLIDLEEGPVSDGIVRENSCVGHGKLPVDYTPYQKTNQYRILPDKG